MANQSTIRPDGTIKIPTNYPNVPKPGKITLLYDRNKRELYHRLSPYGTQTFLGIKTRQPFKYTYPDEGKNSLFVPDLFEHSIDDVKRVTNFLISPNGLLFLGKQFLLQTGNAFNETRLYNPLSPSLAAGMPLALWATRPMRHIDTTSLGGLVGSFLGSSIGSLFGGNTAPPPGTVGRNALPFAGQDNGKGLLRAGTANTAKTNLNNYWVGKQPLSFGSALGQMIKGLFGNFFPQRQPGTQYRADENVYGLMVDAGNRGYFAYRGASRFFTTSNQRFVAGGPYIRTANQNTRTRNMLYPLPNGNYALLNSDAVNKTVRMGDGSSIFVGFSIRQSLDSSRPGVRYEDAFGVPVSPDFYGSDVMVEWSYYQDSGNQFKTKQTDRTEPSVADTRDTLQRVIDSIGRNGLYSANPTQDSSILPSGYQSDIGYDRLNAMRGQSTSDLNYKYGVLAEYRKNAVSVLDAANTSDPVKLSKKFAGKGQVDGINTLTVLDGDKAIKNSLISGWTEWQPYRDDQIAFYFYDVVNDKYVPFRAIIRGLQETDSVSWEELSFIGRADRLYVYSGYNRSLSLNFTVNINSIYELAPTWQRINYLMSLVKPANYTKQSDNNLYTRFMVPPMVMLTVGDMYKNQPVVLGSAGITIPDSATWETLNENNSSEWSYLAGYIKAPKLARGGYAQLPRTVEISINAYLLEQERAIAGAAHFGRAPHTEEYKKGQYRNTQPDFTTPSEFDKSLVVYQSQTKP